MRSLLLMNPNSNAATTAAMVAIAGTILPQIEGWTAPGGPGMIVTPEALDQAAVLVGQTPLPALDGVIVAAFGDPGRETLAQRLTCPVVGIGAAAAIEAGIGGRRFAVVTTTPQLEARIDALMRGRGDGAYLGCHFAQGDALGLMAEPERLDAALLAAIEEAARAGAEAAIIGGGPLREAAERLASISPVPLVAPIRAAARALLHRLEAGPDGR